MNFIKKIILSFFLFLFVYSCNNQKNTEDVPENFPLNGTFCADIIYFNPKTNFRNNYTLNVLIENNYLKKIIFNNGGYLDESHFTSNTLNNNYIKITTDRGVDFEITLNNNSNCTISNTSPFDEDVVNENYNSITTTAQLVKQKIYVIYVSNTNVTHTYVNNHPTHDPNDLMETVEPAYRSYTKAESDVKYASYKALINSFSGEIDESIKPAIENLMSIDVSIFKQEIFAKYLNQDLQSVPQILSVQPHIFYSKDEADKYYNECNKLKLESLLN